MDAQFAILSGQTTTTGTGPSAATPAGDHGFDALLSAVSPITPVPPVTPRTGSGTSAAGAQTSTSTTAGTTALATGVATAAPAGPNAPGTASIAAPTTGATQAQGSLLPTPAAPSVPGQAVAGGNKIVDGAKMANGTLPTGEAGQQIAAGGQQAGALQPGAAVSAQAGSPLPSDTANPASVGISAKPDGSAKALPGETSAVISAMAGKPGPATNGQSAMGPETTTPTVAPAATSGSPVAAGGAIDPAVLAQMTPEAGVQARRAADSGIVPLASPPATKGLAKPATGATPTVTAQGMTAPAASKSAGFAVPQSAAPDVQAQPVAEDGAMSRSAAEGRQGAAQPADAPSQPSGSDADSLELGQTRAAETARAAERPGTAAGTARFTPANAGALAAQIAARFQNGERRFEIRMDPPELGRVEVRLHVGQDNRVQAILSADRPETLQDMRQHIRELERALNEAGLDLDEDGLSFELTQDQDDMPDDRSAASAFTELALAEDRAGDVIAAAPPRELYGFRLASGGGVDIRL